MTENDTAAEKATENVEKRAQWEAFDFAVPERGRVRVENHSHADPDAHSYTVTVDHGSAVECSCPADTYHSGACKHRTAVENTPAVLAAASGVATDGGQIIEADDDGVILGDDESADGRPDECNCGDWNADADLPCWPCYRAGFERPAGAANDDGDDTPRRHEPADFGGGESTGVQDL
jgi:hypothetical protein